MHKIMIYRNIKTEWRWKLIAKNGETIAESGKGYKTRSKCLQMMTQITKITGDTRPLSLQVYDHEKAIYFFVDSLTGKIIKGNIRGSK